MRSRIAALALLAVVALGLLAAACSDDDSSADTNDNNNSETATATAAPETGDANGDFDIDNTVDLVEALRPSVVHILSETSSFNVFGQTVPQEGVGTGFIIDEEGHIVTNNHVITGSDGEPVSDITVTLADGRQFQAEIVGRDAPTDVAVLQIDATGLEPVELGVSADLRVGQEVVAMGNALNLPGGPTVTKGVVSALNRLIQEDAVSIPDAIQTDASINPGNSGGPLVNAAGEVIGITTAVIRGNAEGIGLAISIDSARPVIEELIVSGEIDRGFLGVTIVAITEAMQQQLDLPIDHGIGLESVQENGPADDAGLAEGDIIVGVEDMEIRTSGDLFQALSEFRAGDSVSVEYYHGDSQEITEVTLG